MEVWLEWRRLRPRQWVLDALLFSAAIGFAVPLGHLLANCYRDYQTRPQGGDFRDHFVDQPNRLSVYGTADCPACQLARDQLTKAQVPFNDLRIDANRAARSAWERLGQKGYPVFLATNELQVGYRKERLDKLVERLSMQPLAAH